MPIQDMVGVRFRRHEVAITRGSSFEPNTGQLDCRDGWEGFLRAGGPRPHSVTHPPLGKAVRRGGGGNRSKRLLRSGGRCYKGRHQQRVGSEGQRRGIGSIGISLDQEGVDLKWEFSAKALPIFGQKLSNVVMTHWHWLGSPMCGF